MSDFFTRLIQATYEPDATMRPRPVAHFEQLPPALPFEPEPPGVSMQGERRSAGQPLKGHPAASQLPSFPEVDVHAIQEKDAAQEERFTVQTTARAMTARAMIDRVRSVKIISGSSERAKEIDPPVEGEKPPGRASVAPPQSSLYSVPPSVPPMVSAPLAQYARNHLHVDVPDFRGKEVSPLAAKALPFASPTKKSSPLPVQEALDASVHTTRSGIDEPSRSIALRSHVLRSQRKDGETQAGAAAPASFVGAPPPQEPSQQAGPVIRVTIGRIVVKAEVASVSPNARPQQVQLSRPALSLTEYLNARDGLNARNGGSA